MPSDKRWTGGAANREWQRGTAPARVVNYPYIALQVLQYLEDCERFKAILGPAHPTARGALQVIYHQGAEEKAAVLSVFGRAMRAKARGILPKSASENVKILYTPRGGEADERRKSA